jgi:toxin ParE1/3/4
MTGEVYKRAAARRDLVQHFVYLAENAGLDTADRFLTNAERCFNELAQQPEMGSPLTFKRAELAGMRKWRVPDFENFLVFYLPRSDGISVVRVLYAARDWWSLLGIA